MSVLTNGLRILSVAQEWQFVVTGVIIILAVYADNLRGSRMKRDRKFDRKPPAENWRRAHGRSEGPEPEEMQW